MLNELRDAPSRPVDLRRSGVERVSSISDRRQPEWWVELPELVGNAVRLRELNASDAPALAEVLGCSKVGEHLTPGPGSVEETERFIAWTRRARAVGRYICFGVVPQGDEQAVGVFQLWPLEPSFRTAEWGFALGHAYWGSGLFEASARLARGFAFDALGVVRLEARAAVDNVRGNGALRKLGAVPEGLLRRCFMSQGEYRDHVMWSILADEWRAVETAPGDQVTGEVA